MSNYGRHRKYDQHESFQNYNQNYNYNQSYNYNNPSVIQCEFGRNCKYLPNCRNYHPQPDFQTNNNQLQCWACNEWGHFARDCPNSKQKPKTIHHSSSRQSFKNEFKKKEQYSRQSRNMKKRAALGHASAKLMNDIKQHDTKQKIMHDPNWMSNNKISSRSSKEYAEQKYSLNNNGNNKVKIMSNTYNLTFNDNIIISEFDILLKTDKKKKLKNIKSIYKSKDNCSLLRDRFIRNCLDEESETFLAAHYTDEDSNEYKDKDVELNVEGQIYILSLKQSYHINTFANINDKERKPMDSRQYNIYQRLINAKFKKCGLKQVRVGKQLYYCSIGAPIYNIDGMDYIIMHKVIIQHIIKKPYLGLQISDYFQFFEEGTVADWLVDEFDCEQYRKGFVTYSFRDVQMQYIDRNSNEKYTFVNGKGKRVSCKQHLINEYKIPAHRIKPERYGLVVDKNDSRFLSQFVKIKVNKNEQKVKDARKKLLDKQKYKDYALKSRADLVRMICNNNVNDEIFTVHPKPICTDGYLLNDPIISMHCNGKVETMGVYEGLRQWRNLSGTVSSTSNSTSNDKYSICILDLTSYGSSSTSSLSKNIQKYINKRQMHNIFYNDIKILSDINDLNMSSNTHNMVVFCMIDDDEYGSKQKRKFHSKFLENKNPNMVKQFIKKELTADPIICYTAMDNVVFKCNHSLYKIKCNKSLFGHHVNRHLLIGFDVNHSTYKTAERPSIAVMVGIQKYYIPNNKYINEVVSLLNHRNEIPAKHIAKKMFVKILTRQLMKMKELPLVLWYFRDGVGESYFEKLVHTEIAGLEEAIVEIKKDKCLRDKFNVSFAEWNPKQQILVVQKRIHADFVRAKSEKYKQNNTYYILPFDVVSNTQNDIYIKKDGYHPRRIFILRDELNIISNKKIMEFSAFYVNLLYTYPYGMPNGEISIPSPIKFSDKKGFGYQELINENHHSINDVAKFLNVVCNEAGDEKEEKIDDNDSDNDDDDDNNCNMFGYNDAYDRNRTQDIYYNNSHAHRDYTWHTKSKHNEYKQYRCNQCSNGYAKKSQLVSHIEKVHL